MMVRVQPLVAGNVHYVIVHLPESRFRVRVNPKWHGTKTPSFPAYVAFPTANECQVGQMCQVVSILATGVCVALYV
jgi:hypothetical protein